MYQRYLIVGLNTALQPFYNPTMDYGAVIHALRLEMEKIDRAIALLEAVNSADGGQPQMKRRGRKSMAPEERKQVAECAGMNRRGVVNERVTQERHSEPS
jgi:hypothetical protein